MEKKSTSRINIQRSSDVVTHTTDDCNNNFENEELESCIQLSSEDASQIKRQFEEKDAQLERCRRHIEKSRVQRDHLQEEIEILKKSEHELQTANDTTRKGLETTAEENQQLRTEQCNARKQIEELQDELRLFQKVVQDKQECEKAELTFKKKMHDDLDNREVLFESRISRLTVELATSQAYSHTLEKRVQSMTTEIEKEHSDCSELRRELDMLIFTKSIDESSAAQVLQDDQKQVMQLQIINANEQIKRLELIKHDFLQQCGIAITILLILSIISYII